MSEDLTKEWKDRFKESLVNLEKLNRWLIILNLTILLTFFQHYFQLMSLKKERDNYKEILNKPWNKFKILYEGTDGFLSNYTGQFQENKSIPLFKFFLGTSYEALVRKNILAKQKLDTLKIIDTVNGIISAADVLGYYYSNLQTLALSQKRNIPFHQLDKETLLSLINVFSFGALEIDTLHRGIDMASQLAKTSLLQERARNKQGHSSFLPEFLHVLSYADSDMKFTPIGQIMASRDLRFFRHRISNLELSALRKILETKEFSGYAKLEEDLDKTNNKISEVENGKFFETPLVGVQISLLQFIILGGLINLIIILFFKRAFGRAHYYWNRYLQSSNSVSETDDRELFFHKWTLGIKKQVLFNSLYSLCISFISVASLVFGFIILKNSILELTINGGIVLLNFAFSYYTSSLYCKIPSKSQLDG